MSDHNRRRTELMSRSVLEDAVATLEREVADLTNKLQGISAHVCTCPYCIKPPPRNAYDSNVKRGPSGWGVRHGD